MAVRLLHLHYRHAAVAGQESTIGRVMADNLRACSEQFVGAHMVVDKSTLDTAHPTFTDDVVSVEETREAKINAIYCEGGPRSSLSDKGEWVAKVPYDFAHEFVRDGGVIVFADIDKNFARSPDSEFCEFADAWFATSGGNIIYLVDCKKGIGPSMTDIALTVDEARSGVPEWLQPVYRRCERIRVEGPVELRSCQAPLAYVGSSTVGSMCQDCWWSAPRAGVDIMKLRYHEGGPMGPDYCGPFASVRQLGSGFVVAIAGAVTPDRIVQDCPGNAMFMRGLFEHLIDVAKSNQAATGFQRFRGSRLFVSHRSIDKPIVASVVGEMERLGIRVWFDRDKILPSDSLGLSLSDGLRQSSHFVLFWSKDCVGAPWVRFELGAAVSACTEGGKPILVVVLDDTPVPSEVSQFVRLDGRQEPKGVARQLADAVDRLNHRTPY